MFSIIINVKFNGSVVNYSAFSTYSYINITLCARSAPKNRELCMLNLMVL